MVGKRIAKHRELKAAIRPPEEVDVEGAERILVGWGSRVPTGILFRATPRKLFADRFRKEISDRPFAEVAPVSSEKITAFLSGLKEGYIREGNSRAPVAGPLLSSETR